MTRKKNSYPRNSFEIPEDITTVFIKVRRYYVPVYTLPQKPEVNRKAIADSCGKLEYILESMQTLSHYDESTEQTKPHQTVTRNSDLEVPLPLTVS